jgi:pyruvate-formate lyase-activating enzyme
MFQKNQLIALGAGFGLALFLYLGCNRTTPLEREQMEQRDRSSEILDPEILVQKRKSEISGEDLTALQLLESGVEDTAQVEFLKQLSGKWFSLGYPELAGYYARKVAENQRDAMAWSIAGTTFVYCLKKYQDETLVQFCKDNAERAFENAISLDPSEISNRVNLATVRADFPDPENPMLGIQMLLDLNKSHPESISVLMALGRLGLQTGQFAKVEERMRSVLAIDPEHVGAACLLGKALQAQNKEEEASAFLIKCN